MEYGSDLKDRLFELAAEVVIMLMEQKIRKETDVIRYQLSKASTSSGANYEEAQAAISRREFGVKVAISLKEMRESNFWLRIIVRIDPTNEKAKELLTESEELMKILGKINSKVNKDK